jgi:hypothetical protein
MRSSWEGTRSGSEKFSINATMGHESKISATVGFTASQSYSWSLKLGIDQSVPAGTSWRFRIDALGTSYQGRYNADWYEMKDGWKFVANKNYGSWTARKYTDARQGWIPAY